MSEVEKQAIENGKHPISEDEMGEVVGGAGFIKCANGVYEAEFPEDICGTCGAFVARRYPSRTRQYEFTCNRWQKTELKFRNPWGFTCIEMK